MLEINVLIAMIVGNKMDDQLADINAVVDICGDKRWYLNTKIVKIYYSNIGATFHYNEHGSHHRGDGPAIEYSITGSKYWYLNGKRINVKSQKEFEQFKKLMAFI
jgi:hypothetical protein